MKNYLVVGASSGIGKHLAEKLNQDGHRVYATYCTHPTQSSTSNLTYHHLNVLEAVLNLDFLPERLDAVVYCPGSINLKPFARIKPEEFVQDFDLQVVGVIKVVQATLNRLKRNGQGAIVLFSTVAVQMGFRFHTQVSTSKGALEGFTRALAAELAPKIRVNCIAPSLTDTPLAATLLNSEEKKQANAQRHPLQKIGTPADLAEMAAFLISDNATWISGQILHVDGGMSSIKL